MSSLREFPFSKNINKQWRTKRRKINIFNINIITESHFYIIEAVGDGFTNVAKESIAYISSFSSSDDLININLGATLHKKHLYSFFK
jgi:hypothetical protein